MPGTKFQVIVHGIVDGTGTFVSQKKHLELNAQYSNADIFAPCIQIGPDKMDSQYEENLKS